MHDAFWNALVIEVKDFLSRNVIFQKLGTTLTSTEPVLIISDWMTLGRSHYISFGLWFLTVCTAVRKLEFIRHGPYLSPSLSIPVPVKPIDDPSPNKG
jgi:hypothetical protein